MSDPVTMREIAARDSELNAREEADAALMLKLEEVAREAARQMAAHDVNCPNCDDRQCMACVLRRVHEECRSDCPVCCASGPKEDV